MTATFKRARKVDSGSSGKIPDSHISMLMAAQSATRKSLEMVDAAFTHIAPHTNAVPPRLQLVCYSAAPFSTSTSGRGALAVKALDVTLEWQMKWAVMGSWLS
eukprot:2228868-Pleurochrysis_carterae.AAC.1